jgi:hypothetical protein
MGKRLGCLGLIAAVIAGLVVGVLGLGLAAYFWAGTNLLEAQASVEYPKWSALDEAVLAVKLAPTYIALKRDREETRELSLRPAEVNHLLDQHLPPMFKQTLLALDAGDTATVFIFSRAAGGRFVNGEVRAEVTGGEGAFEVKILKVRVGKKFLPHSLFYPVSRWMESMLETQTPFKDQRFRVTGFRQEGKVFKVDIKTRKEAPGP